MAANTKALRSIRDRLPFLLESDSKIICELLDTEIRKRENAGRKATSDVPQKERNRLAQQRFRNKNQYGKALENDKKAKSKLREQKRLARNVEAEAENTTELNADKTNNSQKQHEEIGADPSLTRQPPLFELTDG
jgi:hypothetical protein